jgi:ABC-type spermidine/putrescine transport system permease subunit II
VIIPVMWPGVITTALFTFLLACNDFTATSMPLTQGDQTPPRIRATERMGGQRVAD